MRLNRARSSRAKPAWKYYYEARNTVYYRFRIQIRGTPLTTATIGADGLRVWKAARTISKLFGRIFIIEREDRSRKVAMLLRGLLDGALGRLGPRVPASVPDRPLVAAE
jgi:hypothetical protein